MAYVFRLHEDADKFDWQNSTPYRSGIINKIKDPNGATATKNITSIPSPFAQLSLVKDAFNEVVELCKDGNGKVNSQRIQGNTIYHKLVSDAWDVGQLFFLYSTHQDKLEILKWDLDDLKALSQSADSQHKMVAETLNMYINQDGAMYNFEKMSAIYLLNYIGPDKPAPMNIIGATSPATLFVSVANRFDGNVAAQYNLDYVRKNIVFNGNDRPFDQQFQSLDQRDPQFIEYIFALKASYPNFAADFKEVDAYLDLVYKNLNDSMKQKVDNVDPNSYTRLSIKNGAIQVDVIKDLFLFDNTTNINPGQSDFEIRATLNQYNPKPLVLPVETGNAYAQWIYTTAPWGNAVAPYKDAEPDITKRKLPVTNALFPYLTISDFLEDTMVFMPFPFNDNAYFDGNLRRMNDDRTYLLPVTERFFEFFTPQDLMNNVINGQPMIEMKEMAGGSVEVILRIPVAKGNVEYHRTYYANQNPNLNENWGGMIEKKFGMALIPCAKVDNSRVAFLDKCGKTQLHFIDGQQEVNGTDVVRREYAQGVGCSVETYVLPKGFDYIRMVYLDGNKAVVLPKYTNCGGGNAFTFAVDLGTSNTHIEYCDTNNQTPRPLVVASSDAQIQYLNMKDGKPNYGSDDDILNAFDPNFIPYEIGSTYSFPMRTALLQRQNKRDGTANWPLADANVAFTYEKMAVDNYNNVKTNIKWNPRDPEVLKLYIENLVQILRNKVLLNNGDLSKTKIYWFYPSSMTQHKKNQLEEIWTKTYKKYFDYNSVKNVCSISESIAPYFFFKNNFAAKPDTVTIDVGGGTTDVLICSSEGKMLSSFRFASNAIFGDVNTNADSNGFVQKYMSYFENILDNNDIENGLCDPKSAFREICNKKDSADICSCLFGLKEWDPNNSHLDFLEQLQKDDKLKYVFVVFYSAIFYYVAKQMKMKGFPKTQTIAFSGNGSRTIQLLTPNTRDLADYIKAIFEEVYQEKYQVNERVEVHFVSNPKTVTCKGGLMSEGSQVNYNKEAWIGIDDHSVLQNNTCEFKLTELSDGDKRNVVENVENFIDFIFELGKRTQIFTNTFGLNMSILDQVQRHCKYDLNAYLKTALDNRIAENSVSGDSDDVTETLFFFPMAGMLNSLARDIVNDTL